MYCFKNLHIHAHTPILYFSLSYPTCLTFSGGRGEGGDSGGDDNGDLGGGDDWDGGLCKFRTSSFKRLEDIHFWMRPSFSI